MKPGYRFVRRHWRTVQFMQDWIVPNYHRSRGPAWWTYKAWYKLFGKRYGILWWKWVYITQPSYVSPSLRSDLRRWLDKWHERLTPWWKWYRRFADFTINCNGCKPLSHSSNGFYLRNRNANVTYYQGRLKLGWFKLYSIRWIENGEPINTFQRGVLASLRDEKQEDMEENIVKEVKLVAEGWLVTEKQADRFAKIVAGCDLDWDADWLVINEIWKSKKEQK